MKRVKVINSHAGLARWLAETAEDPIGYLARCQTRDIPSPYCYSPTVQILNWNGKPVVWFEVSHKRYEIYEVPDTMHTFSTDAAATKSHCESI